MKIVFLASDPAGLGGIQRFNASLLRALRENGALTETILREKFSSPVAFALASLRAIFRIRPDAIFCGHINFAPVAYLASRFGFSYVVFTHGIEVWRLGARQKKHLQGARLICAVSGYTAGRLTAQLSSLRDKIFTLPNTLDEKIFHIRGKAEAKAHFGWSDKKVILTVARLDAREKYKGYDRVLEALPEVLSRVPEAVYVLAGEGSDTARIKNKAAELGIAEKLILPGAVPLAELAELYCAADVFVMPSTGEGFGIVFLEALASGTPVIAGNKDGSRDALRNGELGLLIDPADVSALRQVILQVLEGRLPERLADPARVRNKMLAAFGPEAFRTRVVFLLERLKS